MILITVWFLFCFAIIFFYGKMYSSLFLSKLTLSWDRLFFIGFILFTILCSYLSIFTSINKILTTVVAFFTAGIAIKQVSIKQISHQLPSLRKKFTWPFIYLLGIVFSISLGIYVHDTGLYHAQTIQWIRKFPTITGLGNIHGRLAFNTQFFPLNALFTFDYWSNYLIYPINGVVFFVLSGKLIQNIRSKAATIPQIVLFSIFLFLCFLSFANKLSAPQPDIICACLIIYSVLLLIEYPKKKEKRFDRFLIITLLLLCPIFKLSSIPILLLAIPLLKGISKKDFGLIFSCGVIFFFPFFYKNYLLSGYLIYPFPNIDIFNPDWKIPYQKAFEEKVWIESWARIPFENYKTVLALSFFEWSPIWFKDKNLLWKSIFSLNLILSIPSLVYFYRKNRFLFWVYSILLTNALFWLLTAPDPRFAYGILFSLTALSCFVLSSFLSIKTPQHLTGAILATIFLLSLLPQYQNITTNFRLLQGVILPKEYERADLNVHKSNFTYFSPKEGDQCFNTAIPCTPYPKEDLVLRGKTLEEGFKLRK